MPVQAKPGSPTDANLRPELEPLLGKQDNHDLAIVSGSATEASDCEADKQTAGAFNTQRYQPANSLPADQCGSGRDHTQNSEDDHTGQLVSGQTFSSATAPQQHGCSLHQHVSSDESQQDTPQQAEHDALQQAQHDAPQQAQHIAPQQARHDATQQAHHDSPQQAQHDACQQAQHNATQQAQHDFTLQPGHAQQPDQAHDDQNDTSHEQPHSGVQQDVRQQLASGPNFTLANFTCQRPDGATIVRQVDMQLEAGQVLLITGRSGSGKTTLVNALAGLWPQWHGHRQMLSPDQVCGFTILLRCIYHLLTAKQLGYA